MNSKQQHYQILGTQVVKAMAERNFSACYCSNKEEVFSQIFGLMDLGSTVAWGGSVTLEEIGLKKRLASRDYKLIDRDAVASAHELEEVFKTSITADNYFMSSNAITADGVLVNIDGRGTRLAALLYGPKKIFIVAGMNKVAADLNTAISRARNTAAPINAQRLNKKTSCRQSGRCLDCYAEDCICSHTVITRRSSIKGRIHVLLVGEELGF